VHSKHPFIHQLGIALKNNLQGYLFFDAFSVNKNELVLVFNNIDKWISMKLVIEARTFFIQFYDYPIERKGSTYVLFNELKNSLFIDLKLHENERSFRLVFKNNLSLVFKLYGSLANVLLFDDENLISLFRSQIESDKHLLLSNFTKFESVDIQNSTPTLFYVYENEKQFPVLNIELNISGENKEYDSAFEAFNEFTRQYLGKYFFTQKKEKLIQQSQGELKRWRPIAENASNALEFLKNNARNEEIGHIIMANLHLMKKGEETLETSDFYTNLSISIKLKANLNPQENAQYYYKKARNQKNEEQLLATKIEQAKQKIAINEEKLATVLAAQTMRDLKHFDLPIGKQKKQEEQRETYRTFMQNGWKILVGKSASNNDELTLKVAQKNDLWLHAKGVSGSHVVIKNQNNKPFPNEVIHYAAQLAAYYSKSKGSAMVPVIFTPKKFVRKPKGADPGQVFVEKEELILVEPKIS
jgi:predicted ribosome quality control (RQC) complex YloA/Tae2 family protein